MHLGWVLPAFADFVLLVAGAQVHSFKHLTHVASPWDKTATIGKDGEHKCYWHKFHTWHVDNQTNWGVTNKPDMCIRENKDIVSDCLKASGSWVDCDDLPEWWAWMIDPSRDPRVGSPKTYVDIGTNIGACLLPAAGMSSVDNAVAFEPNPSNLFYLTNSLMANPGINSKVKLFPLGLGNSTSIQTLYEEPGNAGNSIVGAGGAEVSKVGEISIARLDDLFEEGTLPDDIPLLKIDAQGYEVRILQGGERLFSSGVVRAMKFELWKEGLERQGSSAEEYVNLLLHYGYQIHNEDTKEVLPQERLHFRVCGEGDGFHLEAKFMDQIAVRVAKPDDMTQHKLDCASS